jgi:hypothetical protein
MRLQDCATRRHRSGRVLVLNAGRALWNKWARGLALGLGIGLAGCAYHGSFDDPIQRRFQWFSFIGGDDIKAACRPGSSASIDRYRFVYNGRYAEQLRAYELV